MPDEDFVVVSDILQELQPDSVVWENFLEIGWINFGIILEKELCMKAEVIMVDYDCCFYKRLSEWVCIH